MIAQVTLHHTIRTIVRADVRSEEERVGVVLQRVGVMLDLFEGNEWMQNRIRTSLETVLESLVDLDEREKRILRIGVEDWSGRESIRYDEIDQRGRTG